MLSSRMHLVRDYGDRVHTFETALQGQRQSLSRDRSCAQDKSHTLGDSAEPTQAPAPAAAVSQRINPQSPCSASQPVAGPNVPQGWEAIDETDIQQV